MGADIFKTIPVDKENIRASFDRLRACLMMDVRLILNCCLVK